MIYVSKNVMSCLDTGKIPEKAIRNNAGMGPREDLEESVVRTGSDFPAGGNHCLSKGLTRIQASELM